MESLYVISIIFLDLDLVLLLPQTSGADLLSVLKSSPEDKHCFPVCMQEKEFSYMMAENIWQSVMT